MRRIALVLMSVAMTAGVAAQQGPSLSGAAGGASTTLNGAPSLPVAKIGDNDLIGIAVYDAPPLTGPVRVSPEGDIRLPMVKDPIHAAGLYPKDLEKVIATVLVNDHLLVSPIVTVSIIEFDSRPITVVGAVKSQVIFQATGTTTLLDAISRAGGLADDAGPEILISVAAPGPNGQNATLTQRVPARSLLDSANAALNIELHGGEVVRVPQAGRVLVVGDVAKSGYYFISDGSQSSVMKALAHSGGLGQRPGPVAYIYRKGGGGGGRNEIPVRLKKIMDRKSPDVALEANDMLYIPNAKGPAISPGVLNTILAASIGLGTTLLYVYH